MITTKGALLIVERELERAVYRYEEIKTHLDYLIKYQPSKIKKINKLKVQLKQAIIVVNNYKEEINDLKQNGIDSIFQELITIK